ncbi:MAG: hypothetical protein HQ582_18520 [Planctomycetes bacterium]|nr:hypothetical protein [Planctomycetota bacterium]
MATGERSTRMMIVGIGLIVLGQAPLILPTTYFRLSPLAAPVREHQRATRSLSLCEVCGAPATVKTVKPYKAVITRTGAYVGYDPRSWPGNSEILLCEQHRGYANAAAPKRLSHTALLYLVFKGDNTWLRLVLVLHLLIVAGGCYVFFKSGVWQRNVQRPVLDEPQGTQGKEGHS